MAKGRGKIRVLTPFTDTVSTNNSKFPADAFVKDWDKEAGAGQQMVRIRKRRNEGIRKTPIGRGVTTRG